MPSDPPLILDVRDLTKVFAAPGGAQVHAVNGVSFTVARGERVGIIGESGSGKSTIGRLVTRLTRPSGGAVIFDGQDIAHEPESRLRRRRRDLQIVFQDATSTLNARHSIGRLIEEPILLHLGLVRAERARMVRALMQRVHLPESFLDRLPSQLSGGQLQRVGIARAIATSPKLVVLDEPTSALDLSIRMGIVNLLSELRDTLGVAMLMISHDLATIRRFADRVLVVYYGRIIEAGPTAEVLARPLHPYTKVLLAAELLPDPTAPFVPTRLDGDLPSPLAPPPGCSFASRCPRATAECRAAVPPDAPPGAKHWASCIHLD
jgi:peptide/nickel transport system ATP-binding protein